EMPLLTKLQERLSGSEAGFELLLVSADAEVAAFEAFRAAHADLPIRHRLVDPSTVEGFAASVGVAGAASLPIHVLTDADRRVRCVRTGGVSERDVSQIEKLLAALR